MLHHSHGADIDAHDFVIRFNTAPVKGFEKHVGGKTSMRILNHWIQKPWVDIWTYQAEKSPLPAMLNASYPLLDEQSFQVLQTFPWEFPDSSVVQNYLSIRKNHPEIRYHMTSSTLFRFMNESLGFVNPTAGMVGVVIGLQICKHVDVYELLPSKAAIEIYHYWEDRGIVFCPHHCQVEHNFLRKYNTLPSAASEATGVVRLSASVHPELRFCLPKVPGLAMPINE
jgi:beta-galactoside alpha2,6-sialyltransferase (sialyltransferase 2)